MLYRHLKIKINWYTMKDNWAFKHLCCHFIKALPQFKHKLDKETESDIKFLCSPSNFKQHKADNKTILHIDSNRWYEK